MLCVAAFVLAACATGPKVTADYDRNANFSAYRTFGFFETLGTDASGYESLITQTHEIGDTPRNGIARLHLRGDWRRPVDQLQRQTGAADPRQPVTPRRRCITAIAAGTTAAGAATVRTHVQQYVEGTLNIDVVDAARKQLVWEGVAVGRVTDKQREERQAALNAAVAEIFSKYPFRAGQ